MEMSGQRHAPADLTSEERAPDSHRIGGWVDPRTGQNVEANRRNFLPPRPRQESNPSCPGRTLVTVLSELRYNPLDIYLCRKS
jgi:hypothetical protein